FPVGPPKKTAVVVQTGARRKQILDAVVITTHKKGGPHVIPTAQSSSGTPAPSTPSSAVQEPDVPVTREEFNRLQEQLQQLKMLHIGVAMQTFGRILDILRQGEVGQGSTSASAQLRYPFEAGNTTSAPFTTFQAANATSAPSTPPRSAENALTRLPAGMPPLIAHPRPHKPGLALGFPPCREATPPAEELPVPGLQTGVDTGDEETDSREASASGMQGLLDYLGDSEDDNMDVVTAEAKEHEV
ncbi:hypothetical protein EV363DRAFT_1177361, partial [Boletus edulis]